MIHSFFFIDEKLNKTQEIKSSLNARKSVTRVLLEELYLKCVYQNAVFNISFTSLKIRFPCIGCFFSQPFSLHLAI